MSTAFISGTTAMLPNSKITFDKFHLVQHSSKAMESEIQPFIKFVGLIKWHWSGIVNYFDTKLKKGFSKE